ncbi:MAG: hypothetical protein U1E51_06240, partial [Candidatus Binatia bacterium]|nr:hypothetical protein [Candidatus Binatia bacterium]
TGPIRVRSVRWQRRVNQRRLDAVPRHGREPLTEIDHTVGDSVASDRDVATRRNPAFIGGY